MYFVLALIGVPPPLHLRQSEDPSQTQHISEHCNRSFWWRRLLETVRSFLIIIEISLQPWDVLVSSLHQRYRLKNINHYYEDNATMGKVWGYNENLVNCERESSCAIVVLQVFAHRKVPGNWRCDFCSSFWNIFSPFSPVNRNAKLLKVVRRAHSTIEWRSSIW